MQRSYYYYRYSKGLQSSELLCHVLLGNIACPRSRAVVQIVAPREPIWMPELATDNGGPGSNQHTAVTLDSSSGAILNATITTSTTEMYIVLPGNGSHSMDEVDFNFFLEMVVVAATGRGVGCHGT